MGGDGGGDFPRGDTVKNTTGLTNTDSAPCLVSGEDSVSWGNRRDARNLEQLGEMRAGGRLERDKKKKKKEIAGGTYLSCSKMFSFPSLPGDVCPDSTALVPVGSPGGGCQAAGLVKVTQASWCRSLGRGPIRFRCAGLQASDQATEKGARL